MSLVKRINRYRKIRKDSTAMRKAHEEMDVEDNESSRLSENERVDIPGVWIAELYTPSTIEGLLKGLSELKWEESRFGASQNLHEWAEQTRLGQSSSWINLGLVSPKTNPLQMSDRLGPLPEGVVAALPRLISITPSITALCIGFIFDENSRSSLNPILRTNYSTTVTKTWTFKDTLKYLALGSGSSFSRKIYSPSNKRSKKAKEFILGQEKKCEDWIQRYLPGVFSNSEKPRFPTAVLLTTEEVEPLSEEARNESAFRALNLDQKFDVWRPIGWPGGRMVLPFDKRGEGYRLTFACRKKDAFPDNPGGAEHTSSEQLAERAGEHITGILPLWSLTRLLDHFHENLSKLRDQAPKDDEWRPIRNMQNLRKFLTSKLYDIGVCTNEISDLTKSKLGYSLYAGDMHYVGEIGKNRSNILEHLRVNQLERAKQIGRQGDLLTTLTSTNSNFTLSISNSRIQVWVIILAIISIIISIYR